MSATGTTRIIREIAIGFALFFFFSIAMVLVLYSYHNEGATRSAVISDAGEKDPDHIETFVKLLSIDPVKGDVIARLEFVPHGNFAKDDGTLARDVKFNVNSANGKQEYTFEKGKRISPIEATLNLYDGLATDYPFDRHSAFLELYFTTKPEKPADKPKKADEAAGDETENPNAESEPPTEEEVPIAVDFFGSIAGFKIAAAKSKESDESYVGIDMKVSRSGTVIFFSTFVMFLMWAMTIAVMILVLSILLRGRKVEITMFSFIAALLFAFAAIRNNQPGIPPIGTYSDFIAFFWAEVILSLCLLTILTTWLLRPAAK